ncbi:ParA family protein [Deinococcus pimensis]|uniref:ParA family protein n=1 Tax=Deinococcus pimensis TaxID=309888 RepID=UPI0004809BED|nr:ParA family protein [Deinococcus pimensis]
MTYTIALTSEKGGVGKSTVAFNLAGALARRGRTVLLDEDARVRSCLLWAAAAPHPLPFSVTDRAALPNHTGAHYLVVDTEGRPPLQDLLALTRSMNLLLLPCGPSGMEIRSTVALWQTLHAHGADLTRTRALISKAPPVGGVGRQARDALRGMGVTTCDTVIRAYTAHQKANEQGVLTRDIHDTRAHAAWTDIETLAEEITA